MIRYIHGNSYKKNTTGGGFLSGAAARTGKYVNKIEKGNSGKQGKGLL